MQEKVSQFTTAFPLEKKLHFTTNTSIVFLNSDLIKRR